MIRHTTRAIVSAGLAGILMLGTCACSTSSTTTTEVTTESTTEDGTTTTNTETTTTTTENGSTPSSTDTTSSVVVDVQSWTKAWEGETEKGQTVYYAQSPTDPGQALIAIYDPAKSALIHHSVGDLTADDEGLLTITDVSGSGLGFRFEVVSAEDDGTTVLDLGDEFGKVTVKSVDMDKLLADLKAADPNGEFMD